jgi:SAM-dependent methyltransferase
MTQSPRLSRDELIGLAHSSLWFNAPLSRQRAEDLIERLASSEPETALDIGCGHGEFLLRLLAATPAARGDGVDLSQTSIDRARRAAEERQLADRAAFHIQEGGAWERPADIVVCIGSSHVWADLDTASRALLELTTPGGLLLLGDGFWQQKPTPDLVEIFGDLPDLAGLVDKAVGAGWRPLLVSVATQDEHDAWESDWRAGLELSERRDAQRFADERRVEYLRGYRGIFGFAWLIVRRPTVVE